MFCGRAFKLTGILTLFFFIWFCLASDFSFSQSTVDDPLNMARRLIQEGNYDGAIKILKEYIDEIKLIKEQQLNLSMAYYLLAYTFYQIGEEGLCDENLRMVFNIESGFIIEESDFGFKSIAEKIKKEIVHEPEVKEEIKKEETKLDKKVIPKPAKKKDKKKFPWLLVIGGVVVVGIALYLLLNKSEGNADEIQIDPNYDTEVLGIEWINIPAGEFLMGDNFNEGNFDERPSHLVYLDSYTISKYEVTFDQYDKFCEETGISKPSDGGWGRTNRPVIYVSWFDAKAFCDWLSRKTGKNIHLPTEAQWEKAARGVDQRRFPWGNSLPNCSKANSYDCEWETKPVGSYPSGASPYGIHDMAGNVWEWCSDYYSSTYYSASPYNNPTGPSSGSTRVLRGGSWYDFAMVLRSVIRFEYSPSRRRHYVGFRLCLGQ